MRKLTALLLVMSLYQSPVWADLLADEQGPTAYGAVDTMTAGDDFLLPSYTVPAEAKSPQLPTPQAVPSDIDILNEIFGTEGKSVQKNQTIGASPRGVRIFTPGAGVKKENEPLLTELPPLPRLENEVKLPPKEPMLGRSQYVDQMLAGALEPPDGVMPKELRVTFYPGQSTFSSESLKWVRLFGVRVANDPLLLAEIRVSGENWPVQEKRLNMVAQILAEEGVSSHQMRIYKSGRNADTILIGCAPSPEYTATKKDKTRHEKTQKTINW